MKKAPVFILGSLAFSPLLAEPCPVSSSQDILSCALRNHPDIQRARSQAARREALLRAAGQRFNPEVDAESSFSDEQDHIQAAYLHTFELGGKRRQRLQEARAEGDALAIGLQKTQEEVALKTAASLYRLSHIQGELDAVQEALDTFGKIVKQYRSRPRLTPEQQVSLNVFLLAQGDYELRKSALLQDQRELKTYFDLATGLDFQMVLAARPGRKTDWPDLAAPQTSTGSASAAWREAQTAVALSEARLGMARSETWPDLKAGPLAEIESGQGQSNQAYGAALSLSLPLYQRNQDRRALAQAELQQAQAHFALRERELQAELAQRREIYALAVQSLKGTPPIPQMEKEHARAKSLFERGLVESSLIIEAHRQMADFTRSLNEQELRAIEALWSIYVLQGRVLQEKL
jgi:outer membrane protein, heavy metal efflux system